MRAKTNPPQPTVEPNLEWAPFGVVVFEAMAEFAQKETPSAAAPPGDGRQFAQIALACSRDLAIGPEKMAPLPIGAWRSLIEKSGARCGSWRRLDLAPTPLGIVPVALVEVVLSGRWESAERAANEIHRWVARFDAEQAAQLRGSFLAPRFARMIGLAVGDNDSDAWPVRAAIGQMLAEREALLLGRELKEIVSFSQSQIPSIPAKPNPAAHPAVSDGWEEGDDAPSAEEGGGEYGENEEPGSGAAGGKTRRL